MIKADLDIPKFEKFIDNFDKKTDLEPVIRQELTATAQEFEVNVVNETPVKIYDEPYYLIFPKMGGVLKNSWRRGNVQKSANIYWVVVDNYALSENNEWYGVFVNYGHSQRPGRYVKQIGKRLKRKWVNGLFFMDKPRDIARAKLKTRLSNGVVKQFTGIGRR